MKTLKALAFGAPENIHTATPTTDSELFTQSESVDVRLGQLWQRKKWEGIYTDRTFISKMVGLGERFHRLHP